MLDFYISFSEKLAGKKAAAFFGFPPSFSFQRFPSEKADLKIGKATAFLPASFSEKTPSSWCRKAAAFPLAFPEEKLAAFPIFAERKSCSFSWWNYISFSKNHISFSSFWAFLGPREPWNPQKVEKLMWFLGKLMWFRWKAASFSETENHQLSREEKSWWFSVFRKAGSFSAKSCQLFFQKSCSFFGKVEVKKLPAFFRKAAALFSAQLLF